MTFHSSSLVLSLVASSHALLRTVFPLLAKLCTDPWPLTYSARTLFYVADYIRRYAHVTDNNNYQIPSVFLLSLSLLLCCRLAKKQRRTTRVWSVRTRDSAPKCACWPLVCPYDLNARLLCFCCLPRCNVIVPLNTEGVYSEKANHQKAVCLSGDEAISTGNSLHCFCQVTSKEKCINSTREAKLKLWI